MKRTILILVVCLVGLFAGRIFSGVSTDSVISGGNAVVTANQIAGTNLLWLSTASSGGSTAFGELYNVTNANYGGATYWELHSDTTVGTWIKILAEGDYAGVAQHAGPAGATSSCAWIKNGTNGTYTLNGSAGDPTIEFGLSSIPGVAGVVGINCSSFQAHSVSNDIWIVGISSLTHGYTNLNSAMFWKVR